jgi:hypothetical protein
MIGADLKGADLKSRVASWAASAASDDATAVRAVIGADGHRRDATRASPAAVRSGTNGGHWKITQYICQ